MTAKALSAFSVGHRVRLVSIDGGRALVRRLRALGLSEGNELEVLHLRSGGVVVARDGNRVALGRGIADKIMAAEID